MDILVICSGWVKRGSDAIVSPSRPFIGEREDDVTVSDFGIQIKILPLI